MSPALQKSGKWLLLIPVFLWGLVWAYSLYAGNTVLQTVLQLIPIAGLAIWVYFFRYKWFLWSMVAILPLSLNMLDVGGGLGLSIPAELMMLGVAGIAIFKQAKTKWLEKKVFQHPLTLVILFNLLWLCITGLTSSLHWISMKFIIMRMLYLWVFFFYFQFLFKSTTNIRRFFWFYVLPMAFVILWAFNKHIGYGLDQMHSHEISAPFFPDHTIYGAALALLIPFVWLTWRKRKDFPYGKWPGLVLGLLALLFLAAVIFSFSRAAWLSLFGAIGMGLLIRFRVSFRIMVAALFTVLALAFVFRMDIYQNLKSTKAVSSGDVVEHASSIGNIETDVSNKERVNRWMSAIRLFEEKPFWGWGPGTYQFQYGPYQVSSEMTRISTKTGDRGDAHSEYLKALSETGVIGLISVLAILLVVVWTGLKILYRNPPKEERWLALSALLGLITYFVHGVVNNFLYTDKMAALFWSLCAILLALDLKTAKNKIAPFQE